MLLEVRDWVWTLNLSVKHWPNHTFWHTYQGLWLRCLICEQCSSYLHANPRIWIMQSLLLTFYCCNKRHSKRAQGFSQKAWIHHGNLNSVGIGLHYCQTEISFPSLIFLWWTLASLLKLSCYLVENSVSLQCQKGSIVIQATIDSIFLREERCFHHSIIPFCAQPLNFCAWHSVYLLLFLEPDFSDDVGAWTKLTETRARQKRWSQGWPVLCGPRRVNLRKRDSGRCRIFTRMTWPSGEFRAGLALTVRPQALSRLPV